MWIGRNILGTLPMLAAQGRKNTIRPMAINLIHDAKARRNPKKSYASQDHWMVLDP